MLGAVFVLVLVPRLVLLALVGLTLAGPRSAHAQEGAAALSSPEPDPFLGSLRVQRAESDAGAATDSPSEAAPEEPSEPSNYHLGVDLSWQSLRIRYITPVAIAAPDCACGMADVPSNLLRASLSIGWSGLSLEGSVARAIATDEPFYVWTAGLRLDTAFRGTLSLGIRMSYVKRTGSVTGSGGRFGGALQIRIVRQFVLYAEAGVDVLDVPQNADTVFSYAPFYGAGVRAVVGR